MSHSRIPNSQDWLLKRMRRLGFTPPPGVCHGISVMGLQALLANDIKAFDQRLELMYEIPVTEFENAIQHRQLNKLNPEKREMLSEIPIFCEDVMVAQVPGTFYFLFEDIQVIKQEVLLALPLILNKRLEEQGGVVLIGQFMGVYRLQDLISYFTELHDVLMKETPSLAKSFVLNLGSIDHAITIGFNPEKSEWLLIDANQLPTKYFSTPIDVARAVLQAFVEKNVTSFRTDIYGISAFESDLKICFETWKDKPLWQNLHTSWRRKLELIKKDQNNLLVLAAFSGNNDLIYALLAAGLDLSRSNSVGGTPLFVAIQNFNLNIVESLLMGGADPDQMDENGDLPLCIAAALGNVDIVRVLVNVSLDLDCYGAEAATPIVLAAEQGHVKIVELLLKAGADPRLPNKDDLTALDVAILMGNSDVVKLLLQYVNPNFRNCNGETPLHLAVANDDKDIVKMLLEAKAYPDPQDVDGTTPLFLATKRGFTCITSILLKGGADPFLSNHKGITPLFLAAELGFLELIHIFLTCGANPNQAMTFERSTPLYKAAENGYLDVVQALLDAHANPDFANFKRMTPLFVAVEKGFLPIVEELLNAGANPSIKDRTGFAPLHIAIKNDHADIVKTLLAYGADANLTTSLGQTALQLTSFNKTSAIKNVLLNAGAQLDSSDKKSVHKHLRSGKPFSFFNSIEPSLKKSRVAMNVQADGTCSRFNLG